MSFLAPLRRSSVQITILAVVVGVQIANVVSSVLHVLAQAVQFFLYPARLPNVDLARAIKSSLLMVISQTVFSAIVAAVTIWLMARLLSGPSSASEER